MPTRTPRRRQRLSRRRADEHPRFWFRRRIATIGAVALLAAALGGCNTRASSIRLERIVGPTGGNVLTVAVSSTGTVVAPTEFGVFSHSGGDSWQQAPGAVEDLALPESPFRQVLIDGAQINYPRDRLVTMWHHGVWLIAHNANHPVLLHTDAHGNSWKNVPLPGEDVDASGKKSEATTDVPLPVKAEEPPRLVADAKHLYLVGTSDVWRFDGTLSAPSWTSIGLTGLPAAGSGLPPAVRNYLPRSNSRPFETITVLSDQLMVFRRTDPKEPWVMTSTLATVDRELLGTPNSDTVYIVAPDSVLRSDDQGERWFGFWPAGQPHIETMAVVPRGDLTAKYALFAGGTDGSIWSSSDAGATWTQVQKPDPDDRAISGIAAEKGGKVVWAATLGHGVLRSKDSGKTWSTFNAGLRATRPLGVRFSKGGDVLVASRAGLKRLTGDPDSGNWATVLDRAATSVAIQPGSNRTVVGTASGDLSTVTNAGTPVTVPNPFEKTPVFEFVPPALRRATLSPTAVVAIAARDGGDRWMAWSHRLGGATSKDAGTTWTPLGSSDALVSALSATVVTQLVVGPKSTMYLVEESPDPTSPALLWRSTDEGESWTTIHAFERKEGQRLIVRPRPPNAPGTLFSAHGDDFARSTDSGATWETINGPWAGHTIVDFAVEKDRATLLVDTRRRYEVLLLNGVADPAPSVSRHLVVFPPDTARPDSKDISAFEVHGRRVVLTAGRRVWIGRLPTGRSSIPEGMAMLAVLSAAIVLIAAAFVFMRSSLMK